MSTILSESARVSTILSESARVAAPVLTFFVADLAG